MTEKTEKKKAGRPVGTHMPPEMKKSRMFSIKISEQEYQELKERAQSEGISIARLLLRGALN